MSEDKKNLDENQENENTGNLGNDDDNFGLPDLDYQPLDRGESVDEEKPKATPKKPRKTTKKKATAKEESEEEDKGDSLEEEKIKEQPVESKEPDFKLEDDSDFEDESDTTAEDFNLQYAEVEEKHAVTRNKEEKKSTGPIVISLILLLVVIIAILGYLFWYKPAQDDKKFTAAIEEGNKALSGGLYDQALEAYGRARDLRPTDPSVAESISAAQNAKNVALEKKKADEAAAALAAEEKRKADEAAAEAAKKPVIGTVERLSAATGKYYVVVASSIDGDLAADLAARMQKKGVNVQILSPIGNVKFHRVTIISRDSFREAQDQANAVKGEYPKAWVVKY